jgi:hypothetical protein
MGAVAKASSRIQRITSAAIQSRRSARRSGRAANDGHHTTGAAVLPRPRPGVAAECATQSAIGEDPNQGVMVVASLLVERLPLTRLISPRMSQTPAA